MIYDKQHKDLLADGWKWDGESYIRDFSHAEDGSAEGLMLNPTISIHGKVDSGQGETLEKLRRGPWKFQISVLNPNEGEYYWKNICGHDNFCTAARAVLGNFWRKT